MVNLAALLARRRLLVALVAAVVLVTAVAWVAATRTAPVAAPPIASPPAVPPSPSPSPSPSSSPSPSPSTSASPSGSPAGCAAATVDRMPMAARAGQVLMVGTRVDDPDELGVLVRRRQLGGVFLAGRSTRPASALRADIAALQRAAAVPLLVALDQEGGSVQTLKGPDFPIIASAQRLGGGSPAALRAGTRDTAGRLHGIGVTLNLAPVADTVPAGLGAGNPPIGAFRRQYGSDPARVAAAIRTVVPASQDAGVLTVLKHFPGLGRVRANTDTSTRAVDAEATAADAYLQPFTAGIEAGSAAVMISSARYPRLDPDAVAAFSAPIVTGLLRERLGFTGLVMSDDLGAAAATRSVPVGERAVRFVAAGGDLVLTIVSTDATPMVTALTAEAGRSPEFAARLTEAARHVAEAKHRAGLLRC